MKNFCNRNIIRKDGQLFGLIILILFFITQAKLIAQEDEEEKSQSSIETFMDYSTLDHEINLKFLRAGNHDSQGLNSYFFSIQLIGLLDEESQHILKFEEKKKIIEEYGTFGHLDLKSFKVFTPDEKGKNKETIEIKGDAVRELVRKVMNNLKSDQIDKDSIHIPEDKVGVMIQVTLYEKGKKYFILDDNREILSKSYFILPFKTSEIKARTNIDIVMKDENGLQAVLEIRY